MNTLIFVAGAESLILLFLGFELTPGLLLVLNLVGQATGIVSIHW